MINKSSAGVHDQEIPAGVHDQQIPAGVHDQQILCRCA